MSPAFTMSVSLTLISFFSPLTRRTILIRFMAPSLGARKEAMRAGLGFMSVAERLVTEDMKIVGSNVLPPFPETLAGIYLREGLFYFTSATGLRYRRAITVAILRITAPGMARMNAAIAL